MHPPIATPTNTTLEAKFNKNLNASALAPNPGTNGTHTKSLTLIRWERNSQNSAFSCKDYRIYLYHNFDVIFNLSHLLLVLAPSVESQASTQATRRRSQTVLHQVLACTTSCHILRAGVLRGAGARSLLGLVSAKAIQSKLVAQRVGDIEVD